MANANPALALRDRCARIVRKQLRHPGGNKPSIELDFDSVEDITSEAYTRALSAYRSGDYAAGAVFTLLWRCASSAIADHLRATIKSVRMTDASAALTAAIEAQAYRTDSGEPESLPPGYIRAIHNALFPFKYRNHDGFTYDELQKLAPSLRRITELQVTAIALSKGLTFTDTARMLDIAESSLRERRAVLAKIFDGLPLKTSKTPAVGSIM
jgi:DNA-directed RNA polymerase specialized sigma24 family protein